MSAASPAAIVAPTPPKRRKALKRLLWAMAALFVGLAGFWAWSDRAAHTERDRLIAKRHANGEPVWWEEVADRLLSEPADETGAPDFLRAISSLINYKPAGPKLPSGVLWDAVVYRGRHLTPDLVPPEPEIVPEVQRQVQLAQPAFDYLAAALKKKPGLLTTGIRKASPYTIPLPHIQDSGNLLRMNFWRVYDALARRDVPHAYAAVADGFGASEQLRREPFVVAQWTRLAMQELACEQLTMCLNYAAAPEAEFRRLDALLAAFDDSFDLGDCLRGECAMALFIWDVPEAATDVLRSWRDERRSIQNSFMSGASDGWIAALASPLGRPARVGTEVEELRLYRRVIPMIDKPDADLAALDAAFADYECRSPMHHLADHPEGSTKGLRSFAVGVVVTHRRLILARLALRLRRYHDQHGKFPDRLEDLCDESMPKIRLDWFKNEPIVYHPTATGFRLNVPATLRLPEHVERFNLHLLLDAGLEVELKRPPAMR